MPSGRSSRKNSLLFRKSCQPSVRCVLGQNASATKRPSPGTLRNSDCGKGQRSKLRCHLLHRFPPTISRRDVVVGLRRSRGSVLRQTIRRSWNGGRRGGRRNIGSLSLMQSPLNRAHFPQKGRIRLSSFPAFDAYLPPLLFQADDATNLCLVDQMADLMIAAAFGITERQSIEQSGEHEGSSAVPSIPRERACRACRCWGYRQRGLPPLPTCANGRAGWSAPRVRQRGAHSTLDGACALAQSSAADGQEDRSWIAVEYASSSAAASSDDNGRFV
jgi:hypothetical protein